MTKNYDAWKISISDFKEQKNNYDKLVFFSRFGLLAPSSHNSQPWEFEIDEKKLSIQIFKSTKRILPVGDPKDTLSYISIGCAIENIIIAADFFGFTAQVMYENDPENNLCATIQFTESNKQSSELGHLFHQIEKRIVNRGKYEDRIPADDFLKKIQQLYPGDYRIVFIKDPQTISLVGNIVNQASIELMDSRTFRKELSKHVKNNFTKSHVGIPAFGMGINNAISLLVPLLARFVNLDKLSEKQNAKLFARHTPVIAVILSREDGKKDKIISGNLYEKTSLYSISEDIKTSPWGGIIVHEELREKLRQILKTEFYPQFLFRMGYNKKDPRHSPRLLVDSVLKK